MAPPSMLGAVVGGYASGAIPGDVLLLIIGAMLVYFGVDLLRPRGRTGSRASASDAIDVRATVVTGAPAIGGDLTLRNGRNEFVDVVGD